MIHNLNGYSFLLVGDILSWSTYDSRSEVSQEWMNWIDRITDKIRSWILEVISLDSAISQWSNGTLQNYYSSQLNQGAGILSHWTPCVYTQSVVQSKMSKCLGLAKKNATLAKSCSYWTRSFLQSANTCYKDLTDMKTEIPSYIMYMNTIRLW